MKKSRFKYENNITRNTLTTMMRVAMLNLHLVSVNSFTFWSHLFMASQDWSSIPASSPTQMPSNRSQREIRNGQPLCS